MVNVACDKEEVTPCSLPHISQMLGPQAFPLLLCVTDL